MKSHFFSNFFYFALSLITFSTHYAHADNADLQFFGDTYITQTYIKHTDTNKNNINIFSDLKTILHSSHHNIINFEGVSTNSFLNPADKKYILKMPTDIGEILYSANIKYAGLSNNHSMDLGAQGLFDTITTLNQSGIKTFGAGANEKKAISPLLIATPFKIACIIGISRTWPKEFWAKKSKPGTAHPTIEQTIEHVKFCKEKNFFTIVSYHWGQERSHSPQPYQIDLARLTIDSGADAVIGHHPHVIQPVEIYKDKPIFYSIGNFVFTTNTLSNKQEGFAVRVQFRAPNEKPLYELIPINVQMNAVDFKPRPFSTKDKNPLGSYIPKGLCKKEALQINLDVTSYKCKF